MDQLLKLEYRKLRKQKGFYISCILMIVLLFFSAMTTKAVYSAGNALSSQGVGTNYVLNAVSQSSFLLIASIFAVILICDDFEQQTLKNIYAKGYSRMQVSASKFIAVYITTTLMFFIVVLSALLLSNIYFGGIDTNASELSASLIAQYIICMANISLCFGIGFIFRKNSASVSAVIIAPMLLNMLLNLADTYLKLKNHLLTNLWISSFMNDVCTLTPDPKRMTLCITASIIYIPCFFMIGALFHKKTEL